MSTQTRSAADDDAPIVIGAALIICVLMAIAASMV